MIEEPIKDGDGRNETLAIPKAVREEVMDRDRSICRFCGAFAESPAIHHLRYRSEGGLHVASNLITVHWMYEPRCHERIHSHKGQWQRLGLEVAARPGLTMLALRRWEKVR